MMVVLLGASAAALHAQDYRIFVMGGGSTLLDRQRYTVYGADFESYYKTGTTFTVGAEIPVYRMLSAEGSYGIGRNNLIVNNYVNSTVPNQETGYMMQDQRVSADVVAHAEKPIKGVRPYFVAGVELDRFSATSSAAALAKSEGFNGVPNTVFTPENKFGYNLGFGLDISLTHMLALRLDARDHIFGSPTFGLPSSTTSAFAAYYPIGGNVHDLVYSIGAVFHFGK